MCKLITIDDTDFAVHDSYVREWGTQLCYDPKRDEGYQLDGDGQHIALTSYGAFGADIYQAREVAARWVDKARRAWQEANDER